MRPYDFGKLAALEAVGLTTEKVAIGPHLQDLLGLAVETARNPMVQHSLVGAGMGATSGAIAGGKGNRLRGAALGAGTGALGGMAGGHFMSSGGAGRQALPAALAAGGLAGAGAGAMLPKHHSPMDQLKEQLSSLRGRLGY